MSESDSFIQEVTEEVRRDRLFAYWKKYGAYVIGAVVAAVAASAWWTWHREAQVEAARELGGEFLSVEEAGGGAEAYETLAAAIDGPAAVVARLHAAAALAKTGDRDGAAAAYAAIAADAEADRAYTDIARIAAAELGGTLSTDERLALLEPAAAPGAPYRLMALEARAAIRIAAGDAAAGQTDLRTILDDPLATQATLARATELLLASGGTIE